MMRLIKQLLLVSLVLATAGGAQAFSLIGTNKTWQVTALGYDLPGDIGGPMTFTEGYRWNVTNIYYAVDASFLKYFGTRGMDEADKAFAILNALPPASQMSANLTEFPQTDALRQNYRASALGILDLKSQILEMMTEQMGLADAVRWTWALRGRNTETIGGVTYTNYTVIKLNYDPVTWAPSSYVNGSLYGYDIREPIAPQNYADAIERSLDTISLANGNPAPVSSFASGTGQFWIGLTRDDVGGLRFLYRPGNQAAERILPGSLVAITNRADVPLLLTNIDLEQFIFNTHHTTNTSTELLSLYTNLVIAGTNSTILERQVVTNVLYYFSNAPAQPVSASQFVSTNLTTNILAYYDYTFDNLLTNLSGVKLLVGGSFTDPLANLLRLNGNGTFDTNFTPNVNGPVHALAVQPDGKVLVGGDFTQVNGMDRPHLARLNLDGSVDVLFLPLVDQPVSAIAVQADGKLLTGGEFATVNGLPRAGIARLNADGSVDTDFVTSANGAVHTVAVQGDGQVLIGGAFTTVNNGARTNLARLNADGTLDPNFVAAANATVKSMALQETGQVLIGGDFTDVNGLSRSHLARLNGDGSVDTNFTAFVSAAVNAVITNKQGQIVIGGSFGNVNGTQRSLLARLNHDGSLDPGFRATNFQASATAHVNTIGLNWDGALLVGGVFAVTNGVGNGRTNFARLNPDGGLDPTVPNLLGAPDAEVFAAVGQGYGNVYIVPPALYGYEFIEDLLTNVVPVTNLATIDLGYFVDTNSPVPVFTTNLAEFNAISKTNSPAAMQTIYPDLIINSSYYTLSTEAFTNYLTYLTNPPYAPAGTLIMASVPVVTNILVTNYYHTYGNVITNTFFTSSPVNHQLIKVYPPAFGAPGTVQTSVVNQAYQSNFVNGSIYIIPTNLVGYQLISTLLTNYLEFTNILQPAFLGTNVVGTNVTGTNVTSTNLVSYTNEQLVTYGTGYVFAAYPVQRYYGVSTNAGGTNIYGTTNPIVVTSVTNVYSSAYPVEFQTTTNSVNIRPGVDKLYFENVTYRYDSLIGQFFLPFTNQYVENVITNYQQRSQVVRRIVGEPDILLLAEDLGLVNNLTPVLNLRSGTGNWENNDAINGQAAQFGPGVIRPPIRLRFSDQLPYYENQTPFFLDESSTTTLGGFVWGAFDGTTNPPVVFPDSVTLRQLEEEVLTPPVNPP